MTLSVQTSYSDSNYNEGQQPMAREYGTPVRPYLSDSDKIDEMTEHTGWSKSQVVQHMVASVYDSVMSGPSAPRPGGN